MSNTAEKNTKKKSISSPSDSMSYSPIQIDKKPAYIPTKVSTDRIMGDIERYQQRNFSMKKKKPEEEQIIFTLKIAKKEISKVPINLIYHQTTLILTNLTQLRKFIITEIIIILTTLIGCWSEKTFSQIQSNERVT